MFAPGSAQILPKTPRSAENPLRVLFIQNDPRDLERCIQALEQHGLAVRAELAQSGEQLRSQPWSNAYDAIVADHNLIVSAGMEALEYFHPQGNDIPVIILTSTFDEEAAMRSVKAGATDCIPKEGLWRLPLVVRRAVEERTLREECARAEQALKASEECSLKMEELVRVAGGVAHDFNNLLTAILGYSDLLLERLPPASQLWRYTAEVKKATERAFALTRQLLAIRHQQVPAPQAANLNAVGGMEKREEKKSGRLRPHELSHTPNGSETILLVEDEDAVRDLTRMALAAKGYKVIAAASGEEALRICESHPGPIHLMVTDVFMPHVSGRELARKLGVLRPETKVLYTSGYTTGANDWPEISNWETAFLEKPFTPETLTRQVRVMLDAGEEPRARPADCCADPGPPRS